jgi:single-strand DNA-binding protein
MNVIYLIGNVGRDPEIRTTQGGQPVASFSLATSERWKDTNGERKEKTTWHNCVVWGPLTKVVEGWIEKGTKIAVSGKLEKRKYTSRDNEEREAVEVNVERIELLGSKDGKGHDNDEDGHQGRRRSASAGVKSGASDAERRASNTALDDLDDDIPY